MNGRPLVFASRAGPCLGWFHPAATPPRSVAVVMCRPMAYEALCSYRTYTQLAEALAAAGFDVLRFDYHGTGDSAGGDGDPDRVEAWLASTEAAIGEALRLSGAHEVALFGMRLGATLAVQAALRRGGVASLMLWAPCASGRAFTREMRAASAGTAGETDAGDLEALGALFTKETLAALHRLDAAKVASAPARDVLVIGRDDVPNEGPLPARYRELGAGVTYAAWPGYAGMMAEPHMTALAPDTLASIAQWLCDRHPCAAKRGRPERPPLYHEVVMGGVVERPVFFGDGHDLFGVLAEPALRSSGNHRADTAVLMLNVGGNYRIGPNRIYVKAARELAAAGYRALRFDVAGIGESRPEAGFSSDNMYCPDATADVSAAIDMLVARGCKRFFLMGICSGSYLAFQTALQDTRVSGLMLMNTRLLEWDAQRSGPWQTSMQQYYKSTRYYRQELLRSDVYARLLRGEVNVRGIAGRLWDLARARIGRGLDRLVRRGPPHEGVLAKFRHLGNRGVETLIVMSEQDDGLDYVQFHLGPAGSRMRGHRGFRMVLIPQADHTFSTVAGQQALIDALREHLNRLHETALPPARLPARVATT